MTSAMIQRQHADATIRPDVAPGPQAPWPIRDAHCTLVEVPLDNGITLPDIVVHWRVEGTPSSTGDNVVVVLHALTGTTEASAWWRGVIGAGEVLDPTQHAIVSLNLLGGCDGTTGPSAEAPDALPSITTRDQARVVARTLDVLGIERPALVCGGSLGGMVTLEFAASYPDRFGAAVALAAPAVQTAQGIAWNTLMRQALSLGGGTNGFALARMIGMLSYRTPAGLEERFGNRHGSSGNPAMSEWLHMHGEKLVARFDPVSYRALIDAMDTHDVGRDRGGIAAALAPIASRLFGVGIPGDLLYPDFAVQRWANASGAHYRVLESVHGHDAFLLEPEQVSGILAEALATASRGTNALPSFSHS